MLSRSIFSPLNSPTTLAHGTHSILFWPIYSIQCVCVSKIVRSLSCLVFSSFFVSFIDNSTWLHMNPNVIYIHMQCRTLWHNARLAFKSVKTQSAQTSMMLFISYSNGWQAYHIKYTLYCWNMKRKWWPIFFFFGISHNTSSKLLFREIEWSILSNIRNILFVFSFFFCTLFPYTLFSNLII